MNLTIINCVIAMFALKEGALRFSVLRFRSFFRSVFRFLYQKTSVFWFWCLLQFLFYFALGFRSPAKIQSGFRICYSMHFGVFPVSLRKICASTTSTACTLTSLILLSVFGFE